MNLGGLSALGTGAGLPLLLVAYVPLLGKVNGSAVWIYLCVSCMPPVFLLFG
jgi:hypothetical protein